MKIMGGNAKKEISLGCKNICLLRFASQTWWLAMKRFFFLPWFPQLSWARRIHDFLHALPRNTSQVCVLLAPQGFNIFLKIAFYHIIPIFLIVSRPSQSSLPSIFFFPACLTFTNLVLNQCVWALIFEQWYLALLSSIDIFSIFALIFVHLSTDILSNSATAVIYGFLCMPCTSLSPTHHSGGAVALLTIHLCIWLCFPCLSFALYVRIIKNCVRSLFTWTDTYVL